MRDFSSRYLLDLCLLTSMHCFLVIPVDFLHDVIFHLLLPLPSATLLELCKVYADRVFENWSIQCGTNSGTKKEKSLTKVKKPFLQWVVFFSTVYDMLEVINLISLFPTPSEGARYTPDLMTFHNFPKQKIVTLKNLQRQLREDFALVRTEKLGKICPVVCLH